MQLYNNNNMLVPSSHEVISCPSTGHSYRKLCVLLDHTTKVQKFKTWTKYTKFEHHSYAVHHCDCNTCWC